MALSKKFRVVHNVVKRDTFTIKGHMAGDQLSAIVHPDNGKIYVTWISADYKEQEVGLGREEAEAWVTVLQAAMKHQDKMEKKDAR